MNRRRYLAITSAVTIPFVAGCIDSGGGDEDDRETAAGEKTTAERTITETVSASTRTAAETDTAEKTTNRPTSSTPATTTTKYDHRVRDVRIYNETNTDLLVTVTISRIAGTLTNSVGTESQNHPSGKRILSDTFELPPSTPPEYKSRDYQNPFKPEKRYSIKISVRNGPTSTYQFGEYGDDEGLLISIKKNSIEFLPIIA